MPPVPPKPVMKPPAVATVTMESPKHSPKSSPKMTPRGPKPAVLPPKPTNISRNPGVNDILKQAKIPSAKIDGKENKPQVPEKPVEKPVNNKYYLYSCRISGVHLYLRHVLN